MKVWIDQDKCISSGLCESAEPRVFMLEDDGLAYVREGDKVLNDPAGSAGVALVPTDCEEAVEEASLGCPGRCIFTFTED